MKSSLSLLRVFRHPLLLTSILVLMLNDHILKVISPSVLTGKLSDFAGLFFFPFMLGAALQFLAGRRVGARRALLVSFALSAAIFTTIKTLAGVNLWIGQLLAALFHLPVRIALDPSDLLAMGMFLPAWWLWQSIELGSRQDAVGKRGWLVLGMAALACVATAPCPPILSVQRVLAVDHLVVAGVGPAFPNAYLSEDQGQTWQQVSSLPPNFQEDLAQPVSLPMTRCDPADERICFRIGGQPRVEGSQDGGETWTIAWQIPIGRDTYLRRMAYLSCGKIPDMNPMDMTFVTGAGGSALVVAMGNEGVLVHTPSAGWQRIAAAAYIRPSPFKAASFRDVIFGDAFQSISNEWFIALAFAYLLFMGLGMWGWSYAVHNRRAQAGPGAGWVLRPLWVLVGWILFLVIFAYFSSGSQSPALIQIRQFLNRINFSAIYTPVALALPVGIPVIWLVIWGRASRLAAIPARYSECGWFALGLAAGVWSSVILVFILWALDAIADYATALTLALLAGLIVLIWGVKWMKKGMQKALTGEK